MSTDLLACNQIHKYVSMLAREAGGRLIAGVWGGGAAPRQNDVHAPYSVQAFHNHPLLYFSTMPIFFRCCNEPCSMARDTVWISHTAISQHLKHEHDIDSDDGFFEWYAAELDLLEPSDVSNNIWRVPTDVLLSELKKRARPQPPHSPPPTKRAKTAAKDRPIGQGWGPRQGPG